MKDVLIGAMGFEPMNDGVKVRCLTAWLCPRIIVAFRKALGILYHKQQVKVNSFIKISVWSAFYNLPEMAE